MIEHNPQYKNTDKTIAIDFDGVIHDNCKGYHDGTCYGKPIKGALQAIKRLSKKYKIVIYTTKARKDRKKVKGRTGVYLVWEWLINWGFYDYIEDVTAIKPPAFLYIDDKGYEFITWELFNKDFK